MEINPKNTKGGNSINILFWSSYLYYLELIFSILLGFFHRQVQTPTWFALRSQSLAIFFQLQKILLSTWKTFRNTFRHLTITSAHDSSSRSVTRKASILLCQAVILKSVYFFSSDVLFFCFFAGMDMHKSFTPTLEESGFAIRLAFQNLPSMVEPTGSLDSSGITSLCGS